MIRDEWDLADAEVKAAKETGVPVKLRYDGKWDWRPGDPRQWTLMTSFIDKSGDDRKRSSFDIEGLRQIGVIKGKPKTLKVCPDCTGELVGHWKDLEGAGALCWMFHHVKGEGIEIEWPPVLTCRVCDKIELSEDVRKRFVNPYHLNARESTHDCGRHGMDSSD